MTPNLLNQCSVCFKISSKILSPLFIETKEGWKTTFSAEALEILYNKQIYRTNVSQLYICDFCKHQLTRVFHRYPIQPVKSIEHIYEAIFLNVINEPWIIEFKKVPGQIDRDIRQDNLLEEELKRSATNYWKQISILCVFDNEQSTKEIWHPQEYEIDDADDEDVFILQYITLDEMNKFTRFACQYQMNWTIKNLTLDNLIYLELIGRQCPRLHKLSIHIPATINFKKYTNAFSEMKNLSIIKFYFASNINSGINLEYLLESLHKTIDKMFFICKKSDENDDKSPVFINYTDALCRFTCLQDIYFENHKVDKGLMKTVMRVQPLYSLTFVEPIELPSTLMADKGLRNLIHFTLRHSKNFRAIVENVLKVCVRLGRLVITDSYVPYYSTNRIYHFPIEMYADIYDYNIKILNPAFLARLEISRCTGNIIFITRLIPYFIKLKTLILRNVLISDSVIIDVCKNCPLLCELNLDGSENISGESFNEIYRLKNLVVLNLGNIITNQINYLNNAIIKIASNCSRLKELTLYPNQHIRSPTFLYLSLLKNLTILDVQHIDQFNDNVLVNIAIDLEKLKKIDCSKCENISDASAIFVISECKVLEEFYAINTNVSQDSVEYADRINNLRNCKINVEI